MPQGITSTGDSFAAGMFGMGPSFTMNDVFNLPQKITSVGSHFADGMFFGGWRAPDFNMNGVFNLPPDIETVGDWFAFSMFALCWNDVFTMNEVFNMPQKITQAGDRFAARMFQRCYGDAFNMNNVFTMPPLITSADDQFASQMFEQCSGEAFTMNDVFNLPPNITTVGNSFAAGMFNSCYGNAFTMSDDFNMPQGITTAGIGFAMSMFVGCFGDAFNMNDDFNLPQGLTAIGDQFADGMFSGCNGDSFKVNDVFMFPQLNQLELDKSGVFVYTFAHIRNSVQDRTAASIINNNPTPSMYKGTFTTSSAFSDLDYIHENWGGNGQEPPVPVSFISLTANGIADTVTTTALTVNFDVYTSIPLRHIYLTGASINDMSTSGTSMTIEISDILVPQGGNVTVSFSDRLAITPSSRSVAVHRGSPFKPQTDISLWDFAEDKGYEYNYYTNMALLSYWDNDVIHDALIKFPENAGNPASVYGKTGPELLYNWEIKAIEPDFLHLTNTNAAEFQHFVNKSELEQVLDLTGFDDGLDVAQHYTPAGMEILRNILVREDIEAGWDDSTGSSTFYKDGQTAYGVQGGSNTLILSMEGNIESITYYLFFNRAFVYEKEFLDALEAIGFFGGTSTAPGTPVIAAVTPGDGQITVNFMPPSTGVSPTSYLVTATPTAGTPITETGTVSPITVTGLTNGMGYTISVTAFNETTPGDSAVYPNTVTPSFGSPPTGIPGITAAMTAMFVLIIISAVLWGFLTPSSQNNRSRRRNRHP
jgi:hypothetical protein